MHALVPPTSTAPPTPTTRTHFDHPSVPTVPPSDTPTWTCATTQWLLTHPSLLHTPPALLTAFAHHSPSLSAVLLPSAVVTAATSAPTTSAGNNATSAESSEATALSQPAPATEPNQHVQQQLSELFSTLVFPQTAVCARELLLTPVRGDVLEASNSDSSGRLRKVGSGAPAEIMGLALECLGALRVCLASARVYRPAPPKVVAAKKAADKGADETIEEGKKGAARAAGEGKKGAAKTALKATPASEPAPPIKNPRQQAHALLVARVCAWSSDVWLEVDFLQVT